MILSNQPASNQIDLKEFFHHDKVDSSHYRSFFSLTGNVLTFKRNQGRKTNSKKQKNIVKTVIDSPPNDSERKI
jgi:hypothetical protein